MHAEQHQRLPAAGLSRLRKLFELAAEQRQEGAQLQVLVRKLQCLDLSVLSGGGGVWRPTQVKAGPLIHAETSND